MSKKIAMAFVLTPSDSAITTEDLCNALSKLGGISVYALDEIINEPVGDTRTEQVIIYASADDDEPYRLVEAKGDTDGRELDDAEVEKLRYFGVCTEFFGQYPRPERYGAPLFASLDVFAEAKVAGHLFPVAEEHFSAYCDTNGDDTPEQVWMTLAIPMDLHAELAAKGGATC